MPSMKGNRAAQPSKWHRQRIAVEALEAQLARQCSLHVEAKLERCLSLEREKVRGVCLGLLLGQHKQLQGATAACCPGRAVTPGSPM